MHVFLRALFRDRPRPVFDSPRLERRGRGAAAAIRFEYRVDRRASTKS